MISRLVRGIAAMFAAFSMGTVIATVTLGVYLAWRWEINRSKMIQMLAIAQGIDLFALKGAHPAPAEKTEPDQPSLEQVIEARALKARDLELREQGLRNALDQVRFEQTKLDQQRKEYQQTRDAFQESLAALQRQSSDTGWDEVRRTLLAIKPKQAKELLLEMLEKGEINDVVALMGPMADNKRAKILGEFKTTEEMRKIDEVLRLLRRGEPASTVAAGAQRQLGASLGAQGASR